MMYERVVMVCEAGLSNPPAELAGFGNTRDPHYHGGKSRMNLFLPDRLLHRMICLGKLLVKPLMNEALIPEI